MKGIFELRAAAGGEGAKAWEAGIFEQFNRVELVRGDPANRVAGRFRIDATRSTRTCLVAGTNQTVRRPPDACGPEIGIMKIVSGRTRITQAGRTDDLAASDVIIFDNRRPYVFEMREDFEHALLLLDRECWASEVADFERHGYGKLPRNAAGELLSLMLEQVVRRAPSADATELQEIALPIAQVAAISLRPLDETTRRDRMSHLLFTRIRADLRTRLSDPMLSPALLAREHGISLRYLHKLFAMHGLRVMQVVRHERLERCAADLQRSGGRGQISAIAARWGYDDYATFRRAFRARFGATPSAFARGSGCG